MALQTADGTPSPVEMVSTRNCANCPYGLTCTAGGTPDVEGQPFRRCE
jgi:hypothetical protein